MSDSSCRPNLILIRSEEVSRKSGVSDLTCIIILFITLSGLFIFRFRPVDWILVAPGCLLPLVIAVI